MRMLVSKKLRTVITLILSRMNFVAIEAPAAGVAASREALEFFDAALGIVSAGNGLQVVADELVQTFAEGFRFPAGAGNELVVKRQGNVHSLHSICGHVLCVNQEVALGKGRSVETVLATSCRRRR